MDLVNRVGVVIMAAVAALVGPALSAASFHAAFEDDRLPAEIPGLSCPGNIDAALTPREHGNGMCLRISNTTPSAYCQLDLTTPVSIQPNLVLEFDHREEIEAGFDGAYLGISFYGDNGKQIFWESDTFSATWRRKSILIPRLKETFGVRPEAGVRIKRIQLYARVKDQGVRGATRCRMTVWFDNIRLHSPEILAPGVVDDPYVCHNNPPLLDWGGEVQPGQRLQIADDPEFPPGRTRTVVLDSGRPFFVPAEPLTPGEWFFRAETQSELIRGWSPVQVVRIPARTHDYRLPPLPFATLAAQPRPRLLGRIRQGKETVTDDERDAILAGARDAMSQTVPEHPGPYKEGDPRWPQWIDWYGKVADKTTARIGALLKRGGEVAIVTRDADACDAAKRLLLEACQWDPEGGSAARYGDLQAAALLQGMLWCYDAVEESLSEAEAGAVHTVIRTRTEQFFRRLSPFRMNPAQNHPWKKTAVVAESALVMMGVFPEAEIWLDTAAHAFAYRILPSMGFQGENQEGISYWSYGGFMLANIADLLRYVANVNVYDHPWLRQTCRFPIYCAPPEAYAISFADNSSQGNASLIGPCATALTALLGRRTRDPYALWYASDDIQGLDSKPPVDLPQSVFYPHIGYVLFNTCLSDGRENVAVGMRCGPYHAGHQHDDNNGFVIHAYGDKLAVDGGYYDWYGSPHFKAYSIRTLAHNTVLVNGEGQKRGTDGRIAEYFDSPGFGWTVGDASNPDIYEERISRFERRILFLKPDVVIVHDLLAAPTASRFDWLLHAHTDEAFHCNSSNGAFRIDRPLASLDGMLLAPGGASMAVTKSFDIPPQKPRESVFLNWDQVQPEWTLAVTPRKAAQESEFLAVMTVRRAGETQHQVPEIVRKIEMENARGCEIRAPYGRYIVVLRRQGGQGDLLADDVRTDGDAAAVLLSSAGHVLNALAVNAVRLTYRGTPLGTRNHRGTWALDDGQQAEIIESQLSLDGRSIAMAGRRFHLPGQPLNVWWATLDPGQRRRCRYRINGWTGNTPPNLRLGSQTISGAQGEIVLGPEKSCLTIAGRGDFADIALETKTYRILPAETLGRDLNTELQDLVVETDHPTAQSARKGKVMDKVGATGGTAFCCIDGPVQWAEWTVDVPEDGVYELLIRGASVSKTILRELRIDGQPFPAEGAAVQMPGTGGWCRTRDDWEWFRVAADEGRPAVATLTAGTHRLRLEFVEGSQNVDCFVLRPLPALEK